MFLNFSYTFFVLQQPVISSQDSSFIQNNFSVIIFSLGLFITLVYVILQIKITIAKNISMMQEFEEKRFNHYIQLHNFSEVAHKINFDKIKDSVQSVSVRCSNLENLLNNSSHNINKIDSIIYSLDKCSGQISLLETFINKLKISYDELKSSHDKLREEFDDFRTKSTSKRSSRLSNKE